MLSEGVLKLPDLVAGGRKRMTSAGETPCSHAKRPPLFMDQLLKPEPGEEDGIPLYDYAFSAASNGPPPKGTPTEVRRNHHASSTYCRLTRLQTPAQKAPHTSCQQLP